MDSIEILYKLIFFSFLGFLYKKYIFKLDNKNNNICFSPELGIYAVTLLYFKNLSIIEIFLICIGTSIMFKEFIKLTGESELSKINLYSLSFVNLLNVFIVNRLLDYVYLAAASFVFNLIILFIAVVFFLIIAIGQRKRENI